MTADAEFLEAFEALRWPLDQWHHRDHIRLAYLYLRRYPFDEASRRISAGIKAHNAAHGIPDLPTSGYHETMTIAWLRLVDVVLQEYGPEETAAAFCDAHPELSQKKTLRLFYSKDLFMSARAKAEFVEPDLAPLPRATPPRPAARNTADRNDAAMAPTHPIWSPRRLHAVDDAQLDALADVLIDCVEGDASAGFMHPLTRERALAFWRRVAQDVAAGRRALLVAEDAGAAGREGETGVCGTVQLVLDQPENQPHRADLVKMLVHSRARRRGLGTALMRAAEDTARQCGKTLLVLDAVTGGDAARLYERLGWERAGNIPGYALSPRGDLCGTTYYYRKL